MRKNNSVGRNQPSTMALDPSAQCIQFCFRIMLETRQCPLDVVYLAFCTLFYLFLLKLLQKNKKKKKRKKKKKKLNKK